VIERINTQRILVEKTGGKNSFLRGKNGNILMFKNLLVDWCAD